MKKINNVERVFLPENIRNLKNRKESVNAAKKYNPYTCTLFSYKMAPPSPPLFIPIEMAKSMKLVAVVATALCFTSLLSFALAAKDPKTVEGLVYCDSCRVKYKTELSDYIAGNSQY